MNTINAYLYKLLGIAGLGLILSCQPQAGSLSKGLNSQLPSIVVGEVSHAIGFGFRYQDDFRILELYRHFESTQDTISYLLQPEHKKLPVHLQHFPIIRIPIKKAVVLSSTQIGMLDKLQATQVVAAVASGDYIWNELIYKGVEEGEILEVGPEAGMDIEQIVALEPDLILSSAFAESQSRTLAQLQQMGIPVLPIAEWQESTMLGRAEWIKLIGALVGKGDRAFAFFDTVVNEYTHLVELTQNKENKPIIMSGLPFKGVWSMPGGESFMAKLFEDAGAEYNWKDTKQKGSLPLDFEAVYPIGLQADVWINPGIATELEDLLEVDSRFVDFPLIVKKNVFNNYKRSHTRGGNDYWESGVVHPHWILADLVSILHPDLLPDHQHVYYERLQ